MPFTVVQTMENGKKVLTCVPEGWVKNNCLAWPRKKADKLSREEKSIPGVDWILMPCSVKRSNLTYNEAQLAISIMTEITDTDEDETPTKFQVKEKVSKVKSHNDILERCLEKAAIESITKQLSQQPKPEAPIVVQHTEPTINNVPLESPNEMHISEACSSLQIVKEDILTSSTHMEGAENVISEQGVQYILVPSQEPNITTSSKNDITEKLDDLTVTVKAMEKNQKEFQETQQLLLLRIISMQAQFEEFLRRTQKENLQKEIGFTPINSLDSLQKLEDTLKDDSSTTELIKKFTLVCGVGKGRGLNNCFTLADVIFDRSFLTSCSWAGGARGEDKKKICFKSFERVINLFFSIISKSDTNFTRKECEEFFKNILRNANRRNTAKMARTSATKTRVKKSKRASEVLNSNQNSLSEPAPSQINTTAAPEPRQNQNETAAPEPGQNQNVAAPEPGENQNVALVESAQN